MSEEQTSNKKKKSKVRGFLWWLMLLLSIAGMVIFGYIFINRYLEYQKSSTEYNTVRDAVISFNDDISAPEIQKTEQPKEDKTVDPSMVPPISVDFNALKQINEDCVGWIYIEANELSFPVMHGKTNDDYIYTTIEGNWNICGSIFVEALNKGDFSDPNTIIYGHTMSDGSMFAANKKFFYEDAYDISPYFWLLTPQGNYKYKIFSIFEDSAYGDPYTLFYGTDQQFIDWCNTQKAKSIVDCGEQEFKLDDHIVTLSCCSGKTDVRRIIQGICISNNIVPVEEDPENRGSETRTESVFDPQKH